MEILKEMQKKEAIKRMKLLKLLPKVIKEFEEKNIVNYSERQSEFFDGILYWVTNEPDFEKIIKEFEETRNALVYHAQLTHLKFGDCLSLLFVSQYQEEWEMETHDLTHPDNGVVCVVAYVANLDNPHFSETGCIGLIPKNGGLSRVY